MSKIYKPRVNICYFSITHAILVLHARVNILVLHMLFFELRSMGVLRKMARF